MSICNEHDLLEQLQEGEGVSPRLGHIKEEELKESSEVETLRVSKPPKGPDLYKVLFRLYVVSNLALSIIAAAGIMGTTAMVLCWQFTVTGSFLPGGRHVNILWLCIFVIPSLAFPIIFFFLMIKASTRMQQSGAHGIIASPLSFFTSNNPATVMRTLLQDSQNVEYNLSIYLGSNYLLASQIVATESWLLMKFINDVLLQFIKK